MTAQKVPGSYVPIKVTIQEAMCRVRLSGTEWNVLNAIIRKTFGWVQHNGSRKTEDYIAYSQITEMTGHQKSEISCAVNILLDRHILVKTGRNVGVNKNIEDWIYKKRVKMPTGKVGNSANPKLAKPPTDKVGNSPNKKLAILPTVVGQTANKKLAKHPNTKETKETYTKEITVSDCQKQTNSCFALYQYVADCQGLKPFPDKGRQLKAAKSILTDAGYTLEESKAAVDRMHGDEYWWSKIFDVVTLTRHIARYSQTPELPVAEGPTEYELWVDQQRAAYERKEDLRAQLSRGR